MGATARRLRSKSHARKNGLETEVANPVPQVTCGALVVAEDAWEKSAPVDLRMGHADVANAIGDVVGVVRSKGT